MDLLTLSGNDLRLALPMPEAIEAACAGLRALSGGEVRAAPRGAVPVGDSGTTLVMGAYVPDQGLVAKVVSVFPENSARGLPGTCGLAVVLDPETGRPEALVDGTALTAWRTGASAAAAADALAAPDARHAVIIGCGAQAETQIIGLCAVRALEVVHVVGRNRGRLDAFVARMDASVPARVVAAEDAQGAIARSEIVCAATTSSTPVISDQSVGPGTHITSVGSFRSDMREVESSTVRRSQVIVDSLEGAMSEAGDLLLAEGEGFTDRASWTELGAVLEGTAPGRQDPEEITFYKSVGHAVLDVACASAAVNAARVRGLGGSVTI